MLLPFACRTVRVRACVLPCCRCLLDICLCPCRHTAYDQLPTPCTVEENGSPCSLVVDIQPRRHVACYSACFGTGTNCSDARGGGQIDQQGLCVWQPHSFRSVLSDSPWRWSLAMKVVLSDEGVMPEAWQLMTDVQTASVLMCGIMLAQLFGLRCALLCLLICVISTWMCAALVDPTQAVGTVQLSIFLNPLFGGTHPTF